jgi:hypothetical protein
MIDKLSRGEGTLVPENGLIAIDAIVKQLSHKDRQIRKNAVIALGETGDVQAIRPLISALSRELSYGARSYGTIAEIIIAMSKIPNRQFLDALIKLESQLVDRGSQQCPHELPPGVITYIDVADCRMHRIVPRELHFKVLDVMRRMSVQLNDRSDFIADRYNEYQQAVTEAEVSRMMPAMSRLLRESGEYEASQYEDAVPVNGNGSESPPVQESLPADAMAGVDYDIIRREIELEVAGYVRDNDKVQSLVQDARRIKSLWWPHRRTR